MVRAYHTIKPVEITIYGDVRKAGFEEQRADRGPLVMPDLDHEPAVGFEPTAGLGRDDAVWREAIRAAIERQAGIEILHLGGQRFDDSRCDVRRVRDDEVESFFTSPPKGEVKKDSTSSSPTRLTSHRLSSKR